MVVGDSCGSGARSLAQLFAGTHAPSACSRFLHVYSPLTSSFPPPLVCRCSCIPPPRPLACFSTDCGHFVQLFNPQHHLTYEASCAWGRAAPPPACPTDPLLLFLKVMRGLLCEKIRHKKIASATETKDFAHSEKAGRGSSAGRAGLRLRPAPPPPACPLARLRLVLLLARLLLLLWVAQAAPGATPRLQTCPRR